MEQTITIFKNCIKYFWKIILNLMNIEFYKEFNVWNMVAKPYYLLYVRNDDTDYDYTEFDNCILLVFGFIFLVFFLIMLYAYFAQDRQRLDVIRDKVTTSLKALAIITKAAMMLKETEIHNKDFEYEMKREKALNLLDSLKADEIDEGIHLSQEEINNKRWRQNEMSDVVYDDEYFQEDDLPKVYRVYSYDELQNEKPQNQSKQLQAFDSEIDIKNASDGNKQKLHLHKKISNTSFKSLSDVGIIFECDEIESEPQPQKHINLTKKDTAKVLKNQHCHLNDDKLAIEKKEKRIFGKSYHKSDGGGIFGQRKSRTSEMTTMTTKQRIKTVKDTNAQNSQTNVSIKSNYEHLYKIKGVSGDKDDITVHKYRSFVRTKKQKL